MTLATSSGGTCGRTATRMLKSALGIGASGVACRGSNVIATRDLSRERGYVDMLLRELYLKMELAAHDRPVN